MIRAKFYLDGRTPKKDGTCPIKINVTRARKVFYVNTGFSVLKERWDGEKLSDKEPNYRARNVRLREMMNRVERVIFDLEEKGRQNSIPDKELRGMVEDAVFGKQRREESFLEVLDRFAGMKINPGTRMSYGVTRKKVEVFDAGATFETMTVEWLTRFENEMVRWGMATNYRWVILRNIRAVFNYAIDNGLTTLYPFRRFKLKWEETAKRSLTLEELRRLRDCPLEGKQEKCRDMFMLMFYLIGINAVDLFLLPPLQGDRIRYHRAKTGKLYEVKVEPEALAIIEKYKGDVYMLDVMDGYKSYRHFLARMDRVLKGIGPREGEAYFPGLSSYWARHTWATLAAGIDVPKETIAEALGHWSGSVTDVYIRFDRRKVDEANRAVLDLLK